MAGETKKNNYKRTFFLLLLIWFVINLIQAIFTEMLSDEAYYGLFGRYLDWGYYDHPPMVALMTKLSSLLFDGNLGIRFVTIVLQLGTIILIWKIADFRNPDSQHVVIFFIIAASISLFSIYGVLTSPDAPLLFFTALFFFAYKRFINNESWASVFLLALSMAGLVYSKYHGVLVIGFLILSNFRLLKNYKFWVAGLIALTILSPHFYWQISNDFPSIKYHIVRRSENFKWAFVLEYLPNQMAVFNPLTLGAVIYVMVRYKPVNQIYKSYYFQIAGFLIFFWLSTFQGHVEPQWTIACSIPVIVILSEKCLTDPLLLRFTRKFILPSILLLLAIRIFMMTDNRFVRNLAFNGKENKYKAIETEAGELPVVFSGGFQRPSLYTFFTGKEAMTISSIYSRQTQFDLWQFEKKYQNKPAFICLNQMSNSKIYVSDTLYFGGFRTDSLQTVNRMKIKFSLNEKVFHPGDSVKLLLSLSNPYENDIDFDHRRFPVNFCLIYIQRKELHIQQVFPDKPVHIVPAGETIERSFSAVIPELPEKKYNFGISLNTIFGPSFNSGFVRVKVGNDD